MPVTGGFAVLLLGLGATDAPVVWSYEVSQTGDALRIEARFPPNTSGVFEVRRGAETFIEDVKIHTPSRGWRTADRYEAGWSAYYCQAQGCTLRYKYRLRDAAHNGSRRLRSESVGAAITTAPSHWLLGPRKIPKGARYRLRVTAKDKSSFVFGVPFRNENGRRVYEAPAWTLGSTPHAAFGPMTTHRVKVQDARIDVALLGTHSRLTSLQIAEWIQRSGAALAHYLGRFPLPYSLVIVVPAGNDGVPFGTVMGFGGATIKIYVGHNATLDDLNHDWKLIHEMVHMAFPNVGRPYRWVEEGLATYVEAVIRTRLGITSESEMWQHLYRGMQNGLPDGEGFDGTRSWGEVYWGGALFFLMADIQMLRRSKGRRGLDMAIRHLIDAGGTIDDFWNFRRVRNTMDEAIDGRVFSEVHAHFGIHGTPVDLDLLWSRLGIDGERFKEDAPWASIRKCIVRRRPVDIGAVQGILAEPVR